MQNQYKPTGYNSVSPYFVVEGAQQMIDFMEQLFGAKEVRRYNRPDGKIMHAEVRIDDSIVMLSDATDKFPATTLIMHVYMPDADAIYKKAMELGCVSLEKPTTRAGDPDKRCTFTDFAGNMWSVGTQLSDI